MREGVLAVGERLDLLGSPIKVGNLTLRNHMMTTAMGPGAGYITMDGRPTQRLLSYLEERSAGGMGLICQTISPWRRSTEVRHPLVIGADEECLPELKKMADAVHKHGGLLVGQPWCVHLWCPGDGRPEATYGPSEKSWREPPYTRMTLEDIELFKRQIINCAVLLKKAGFDGVEVMAGVGGIMNRFLSLATNDRTDQYGGSLENRAKLTLEVLRGIKEACGEDYTVLVRWSPVEYVEGGVSEPEESFDFARMLDEAGCDLHNLAIGWHETSIPLTIKDVPDGHWSWVSEKIKQVAKAPVATAYRETDPYVMERILQEGKADLIAGLRYNIADPAFAKKVMEGRQDEINRCVGCCRCLDDVLGRGLPLNYCSVNPRLGEELDEPLFGKPASSSKRVAVVGAGMAGVAAAVTCARRGHRVTLYEKGPRIGGAVVLSAVFSPSYQRIVERCAALLDAASSIDVRLNTEATVEVIEREHPDAVIVAMGGEAMELDVPGADGANVVQSHAILEMVNGRPPSAKGALNAFMYAAGSVFLKRFYTPELARWALGAMRWPLRKSIAIIGGGLPGCELAKEMMRHGRKITIVDDHGKIGWDVGSSDKFHIVSAFKKAKNVVLKTQSTVKEIRKGGVVIETAGGDGETVVAKSVVIALGFQKNTDLGDALEGVVDEVYLIGDCAQPLRMADATKQGYRVGCRI